MYVYNGIAPPYASAVLIDLIQLDCGSYVVQVLYRNDTTHDPYPLLIPGNKPFNYFVEKIVDIIIGLWRIGSSCADVQLRMR